MTGRPEGPSRISGDIELGGSMTIRGTLSFGDDGETVPGPGIDTTAVHVGETTEGDAGLTGDFHVGGALTVGESAREPVLLSPDAPQVGDVAVTGALEAGRLFANWGVLIIQRPPPSNFAAVIAPGVNPWSGATVPAGDHAYQIDACAADSSHTLPTDPITVTIPADMTENVLLTWRDIAETHDAYPPTVTIYRDGEFVDSVPGTFTSWSDIGNEDTDPTRVPATVNGTGGLALQGAVLSHGRPVLEVGAVQAETITPDTTITVYTADGTAYKLPAVLA